MCPVVLQSTPNDEERVIERYIDAQRYLDTWASTKPLVCHIALLMCFDRLVLCGYNPSPLTSCAWLELMFRYKPFGCKRSLVTSRVCVQVVFWRCACLCILAAAPATDSDLNLQNSPGPGEDMGNHFALQNRCHRSGCAEGLVTLDMP